MKSKLYLDKIVKAAENLNIDRIILFGSQAKLQTHKDSDLDLCLVTQEDTDILNLKYEFQMLLWKLKYNWPFPLDLHVYSQKKFKHYLKLGDPFIKEINKGQVIYEKP